MKISTKNLPPRPTRLHSLKELTDQELALIRHAMSAFKESNWFTEHQAGIVQAAITRFLDKTRLPVTSLIFVEGMFK